MSDYEHEIPHIWAEELLKEEFESSMAVALIETCGPITLLIYKRCIEISYKYTEMNDLRSLFLTAAACSAELKKRQIEKLRVQFSNLRSSRRIMLQRFRQAEPDDEVDHVTEETEEVMAERMHTVYTN